ncbi:MAG TPA: hypothetical protein ENG09_01400 [Candidatus Syntrophoarchaeum butanivorans]|uniref:Uncharacterized protein n=1 Tax=Candidatus Syntropharchaeum butanivorans TaxID=1839936 RepID=A0A7C1B4S9_9EURY|nr:hypothetical protein [Candidatus Syntrophoarchaeum butanivorans]
MVKSRINLNLQGEELNFRRVGAYFCAPTGKSLHDRLISPVDGSPLRFSRRSEKMRIFLIFFLVFLSSSAMSDKLVFGKDGEIYVADINRRGEPTGKIRNLTNHPSYDDCPSWSPDGRKIAFITKRDGFSTVYVMDSNGRNPHPLNKKIKAGPFAADWSPDGRKIAVCGDPTFGKALSSLFIVSINGKILSEIPLDGIRLSAIVDPPFKWSPDGKSIACIIVLDWQIGIIDTKNWQLKAITREGETGSLDWSEKGEIVFLNKEEDKYCAVLITPEGNTIRKYPLPGFLYAGCPVWSPDCDRILFEGSQKKEEWFLFVLDLRSGDVRNTGIRGARPDWWGRSTAVEPLNLFNTLWGLIKMK